MPQAAPLVATEAAVASTMTAAEIAAAEAAAAHAAQVAAAQTLAAEQAAALAAQQATAATTAAAEQAANSGIQTLAQEVAGTQPAGIDQLTQAFQNAQVNNVPMSQAEFLNQSFAGPAVNTGSQLSPLTPGLQAPIPVAPPAAPNAVVPDPMTYFDPAQPFANPTYASAPPAVPTMTPPVAAPPAASTPVDVSGVSTNTGPSLGGEGTGYRGNAVQIGSGSDATPYTAAELQTMRGSAPAAPQEPGGLQGLFNQGLDYAKNNKLTTLMGANTLYNALNKPDPYEEKKYKSTFKPGLYSGYTPVQPTPYRPQYAAGGVADLGGYSDGGRMLKGPGDGMSDDIPATIANKQPARLANEEFVIPADVVSHLGNGSSEAGAKQLYKMMERVRKARTGNKKQGKQINPDKYLA